MTEAAKAMGWESREAMREDLLGIEKAQSRLDAFRKAFDQLTDAEREDFGRTLVPSPETANAGENDPIKAVHPN